MMNCREFADLLLDFLSEELSPEQFQRANDHLALCPPCVAYVETYQLTIKLTKQLPCDPLPPTCEQRLRAAVEEEYKEHLSKNS